MEFWISESEKQEQKRKWKQDFKNIGEDVYTFFIDTAIQMGFEDREGQWDMSFEIADAMKKKQHILVEAGVGIGKTFAYIVPLLYYHKRYKKPIIIATSTIALQEQLAADVKVIEDLLGYHPDIVLAKGQNHFLCKYRCDEHFLCEKDEAARKMYEEIDKGGCQKADWDFYIPDNIWNQINVKEFNPVFCRQNCVHKEYCFYYELRQELLDTNGIILCNQDLLTINLKKRYSYSKEIITNKFQFVVIDEVHNLESKVRNSYTMEVSYASLQRTIEQGRKLARGLGYTIDLKIKEYYKYLEVVFDALYLQIRKQDEFAKKNDKEIERYYIDRDIPALQGLKDCVHDIFLEVSIQFGADDSYRNKDYDAELDALELQETLWESMLEPDSADIFWMNIKGKGKKGINLFSCPKDVNRRTETLFFSDSNFTTILTSATITSGVGDKYEEGYKYFIANTNFPIERGFIAEPKVSPFNYDEHAMIYYTEDMPHPSHERKKFIEKGIDEIVRLLEISEGKALILFTAKSDMEEVYEDLKNKVPYKVLMQNQTASQSDTITEFKKDVNSVLLGTGTYWEGISVEGIALSNLIIFRLPFPVPEPIIDYKTSICQDGLMEVLVPEMIIKLKQGIGRLIRSEKDFGLVSIIDSRVGEKSKAKYKQMIWDALPIKNKTSDIEKIKKFYNLFKGNNNLKKNE